MKKKKVTLKICTLMLASILLTGTLPVSAIANGDAEIVQDDVVVRNLVEEYRSSLESFKPDSKAFHDSILITEPTALPNTSQGSVSTNATTATLPSSVDLSTSTYFPDIGDQGFVGSCAAFATTYYQFTYEANKLNGIPTTPSNTYSPTWPYYYYVEGPSDEGMYVSSAYNFLKEHGGVSLEHLPYNGETFDNNYSMPTNVDAMREALNTRVSSYSEVVVNTESTPINSPSSSVLNNVKQLLANGKILVISTTYDFEYATHNGKLINFRCNYNADTGHAMAVVGYDDSVSYDVNKNGTIENAEKGAFKLANSWGVNHGTSGYEWVLYDALNSTSQIGGNWESKYSEERHVAFEKLDAKYSTDKYNRFMYITVKNYDVNFVSQLYFNNISRDNMTFRLTKANSSSSKYTFMESPRNNGKSTFTLLYDCCSLETNLATDISNTRWGVEFTGAQKNLSSGKITDDYGNIVGTMTNTASCKYSVLINLMRGDLSYDGVLNIVEAQDIIRYITGHDNLSNLQIYLADYNQDGIVSVLDATAIAEYITANS